MAAIDGVVFKGIEAVPYASVRLLTTSGHCVSEQTANSEGEFRFVVPSGVWGVEALSGEQTVALRDVVAMDGERLPVYMRMDTGERVVHRRTPAAPVPAAIPTGISSTAPEAEPATR